MAGALKYFGAGVGIAGGSPVGDLVARRCSASQYWGCGWTTRSMLDRGDTAPTFSATRGTAEHESFEFDEQLGDGPVVLAFFPGAFTPPCTNEMVALQERIGDFHDAGATVLGVSADSPFSQGAFREEFGLDFELVSDTAGDVIRDYDLEMNIEELGLYGIANRAVFVLDEDGAVTYRWIADDPTTEPEYDEVLGAVRDV